MAKLFASDVALKVTIDAIQILGGYGHIKVHPIERVMRVKGLKILSKEGITMGYKSIIYEKEDKIVKITLNRPDKLNGLNEVLLDELEAAAKEADRDNGVRVVIIKGAGRAFSSGLDLRGHAAAEMPESLWEDRQVLLRLTRWILNIRDVCKPVIAQVHGYCIAQAFWLITVCDLVVVADDARLSPYPTIRPLGATTQGTPLSFLVGAMKAKEFAFVPGRMMDGKEAERIGLANFSVPYDKLDEEVEKLARSIAKVPLEILSLEKVAINRAQDGMGFQAALWRSAELDIISHSTEPVRHFAKLIREHGIRQVREWWQEGAV